MSNSQPHPRRLIHRLVLAVLVPAAIALAVGSAAATLESGIGVGVTTQFGTLPERWPGLTWGCFTSFTDSSGTGWLVAANMTLPRVERSNYISSPRNVGLWLLRTNFVDLYNLRFGVEAGAGWGVWRYRMGSTVHERGAIGFSASLTHSVPLISDRPITLLLGYTGGTIPGAEYTVDHWEIGVRYALIRR